MFTSSVIRVVMEKFEEEVEKVDLKQLEKVWYIYFIYMNNNCSQIKNKNNPKTPCLEN